MYMCLIKIKQFIFLIFCGVNYMSDDILRDEKNVKIKKQGHDSEQLGITQEYTGNRELWDSAKAKQEYRDSVFGTSKTIVDENSGQVLHKSHSAAKRKYHQKNSNGDTVSTAWAGHAAEVDHKVSLESLHSRVKSNPFLTDSDLKEIANKDYNYQILSKSQNASKGADSSLDPLIVKVVVSNFRNFFLQFN